MFTTVAQICIIFDTLQCHVVPDMHVNFTFTNCLTQSAALPPPGERQQLVLALLKTQKPLS